MPDFKAIIKRSILWKYMQKPYAMFKEARFRGRLFAMFVLSCIQAITNRKMSMEKGFVIVTGADSSHYRSLTNFLCSLFIHIPNAKVVVFDLGLTDAEREQLVRRFKTMDLRKFDDSKYPDHVDIRMRIKNYSWKPIIAAEIMNEFKCCTCWMDAGTIILSPLTRVRRVIQSEGVFNLMTAGDIREWTHPGTLEYMNVSAELLDRSMGDGSFVGVNYENIKAREMINKWKECALIKECILPKGSDLPNHRQDQSVLTVLVHQNGFPLQPYGVRSRFHLRKFEFKRQQDLPE